MAVWLEFPHSTKLSIQTSVAFEFIVWSRFPSSFIQIRNVNWTLNSFSSYECLSAEFKLSTCKDDASKGRPTIKTVITRRIGRLRPINLGSFSIEIHCNRSMIWSHISFINTSTLACSYNGKKSRYCYLESRQWFYLHSCFRENRRTNFVITCEIVDISYFFFFWKWSVQDSCFFFLHRLISLLLVPCKIPLNSTDFQALTPSEFLWRILNRWRRYLMLYPTKRYQGTQENHIILWLWMGLR